MNGRIVFEDDNLVLRMSSMNEDGDVMICVHRKKDGVERRPATYSAGRNCILFKEKVVETGAASNVVVVERPRAGRTFADTDHLRDLFGQWPGSELATKTTYVPTGRITTIRGYNVAEFLSLDGCRTFDAFLFDWMGSWMLRYAPEDLTSLRRVDPSYDFAKENA